MQMKTRKERRFAETEAGLPGISQSTAFKLPGGGPTKLPIPSRLGDVLSYLGPYNPRPQPITGSDAVWLFDNVAHRGPRGKWEAEFVAAVLAQDPSCKVADVVSQVAEMAGLSKDAQETATIARRITPFLMDIQPGRLVNASFGSGTKLKLGPGGRNGISSDIRQLPSGNAGDVVTTTAEVPSGANGLLEMKTLYTEPDGWAVISGKPSFPSCCGSRSVVVLRSNHSVPPDRRRRHNQSHDDQRPDRHLALHIHIDTCAHHRHAGALRSCTQVTRSAVTIFLPVGVSVQPLPIPSQLPQSILSIRRVDPP